MSGPPVLSFEDFHEEVHGVPPLPWQSRLARQVVDDGWPARINVPTGLGKTSCLDIAVWSLAHNAASDRRLPTRVWYVVNRRLLVDAAYDRAVKLQLLMVDAASGNAGPAVASVAFALRDLGVVRGSEPLLHVTRLRGGAEIGARSPDPSKPSIVLATVPMFASRWLFRGYGSSRSTRPIDAAHAGADSLVLMDEAHLARTLVELAPKLAECDAGEPARTGLSVARARPRLVSMSATGDQGGDQFCLDGEDLASELVKQRLNARKSVYLLGATKASLAETMAAEATRLATTASESCVVFVNSPGDARKVYDRLKPRVVTHPGLEAKLLTGRMREVEASRVRTEVLSAVGIGRSSESGALVVVATQALEVGADVDFHHLVTESTGVRSLVQRLGRLNRFGDRDDASCAIVHPSDAKSHGIYGMEPAAVWERLQGVVSTGAPLDLSPGRVAAVLGEPQDAPERAGEVLPSHLWEWAKTTVPPAKEAPVELFFDPLAVNIAVSVIWRAFCPAPGERLIPDVHQSEAVEIPVGEVKSLLGEGQVLRLASDKVSVDLVDVASIAPGDVVVLSPDRGFYDRDGWAPNSSETVLDVSPLLSGTLIVDKEVFENLAPGSWSAARAFSEELRNWLDRLVHKNEDIASGREGDYEVPDFDTDSPEVDKAMTEELLQSLKSSEPSAWLGRERWGQFLSSLGGSLTRPTGPRSPSRSWITARGTPARFATRLSSDALDELSMTPRSLGLREHLSLVGAVAAQIGTSLGLSREVVLALRKAGEWHDLGKHDPRFQRWLDPDAESGEPMAKSGQGTAGWQASRAASGWPQGGRHEALSARLASEWLAGGHDLNCDVELILHLITTHHGNGRPSVPAVEDERPVQLRATVEGRNVSVSGDLSAVDWGQPGRFRALCEKYGFWGLALLESVLRQADWVVSGLTEVP